MNEPSNLGIRRPKLMLAWTVLAVIGMAVMSLFGNSLNEHFGIQPGILNLLKFLLTIITVVAWIFWIAFFSGHKARFVVALLIVSLIALFFWRFRIIFDGDLGFVRVQSRFIERTFEDVAEKTDGEDASLVDLSKVSSKDFPEFLGRGRTGVVRQRVLNANWKENPPKILWKKSVGEGWSGFTAVNGFAVTQEQRGQDECVTCYEIESGDLMWISAASRRHEDTMSLGRAGPRATPTINDGKVYAQGATGVLDCLDGKDGSVIWSVDIAELLGTEMAEKQSSQGFQYQFEDTEKSTLAWGRSGSPLIYKDKVIATGGVTSEGDFHTLIAFNKTDGSEIWRGGDRMIAYGSPAVARLLGQDHVTLIAEDAAMGFDPESGDVLWEREWKGSSNADANTSQVTRVSDDELLFTKGYAVGGEFVLLIKKDGKYSTETIWKDPRVLKTKMTSPVMYGDYAYSLSDGFLECTLISQDDDHKKRIWRKRGRFGNGQLLLVGRHLLVHTEFGKLKLVEATPESYRELGEIETIDGVCWNTICLYDNYLLVRSELEAACIELKLEVQGTPAKRESSTEKDETAAEDKPAEQKPADETSDESDDTEEDSNDSEEND